MSQESRSGPARSNSNSNSMEDTSERAGHDRRYLQLRTRSSTAPHEQTEQQVENGRDTTATASTRSGGYKCNKCGERKGKNHVCPFQTKIHYVVEAETQTHFPDDDGNFDHEGYGDGAVPNNVKSSSSVAPNEGGGKV